MCFIFSLLTLPSFFPNRCTECDDFDFCVQCFGSRSHQHTDFILFQIPGVPKPPLAKTQSLQFFLVVVGSVFPFIHLFFFFFFTGLSIPNLSKRGVLKGGWGVGFWLFVSQDNSSETRCLFYHGTWEPQPQVLI